MKKEAAPKPRTASLFKSMSVDSIDLETALRLLSLPRVVGADPESGAEITAQNGRYGPYLKKGTDSRTLQSEDQLFDITLDEALAVYAQPKYGARGASSALKEFDADPVSGKPIKIKDGRFGAYVTDGVTNATIPRGETVETVDFERAKELLADKRAKGPAPKRDHPDDDSQGPGEEVTAGAASRDDLSGLFVTFEGGDGVGKTTQSALLEEWLAGAGRTVVRTREPGGTEVGVLVRDIVLHHRGDIAPRAEALLYAADRAHHVETVVRPALARGEVVIQDRYFDSSVAYQGDGRQLEPGEIRDLSMWAAHGLLPDLTVLLDLDPTTARASARCRRQALRPARGRARGLPRARPRPLPRDRRGRARAIPRARRRPARRRPRRRHPCAGRVAPGAGGRRPDPRLGWAIWMSRPPSPPCPGGTCGARTKRSRRCGKRHPIPRP